jgi:hypothetical protein
VVKLVAQHRMSLKPTALASVRRWIPKNHQAPEADTAAGTAELHGTGTRPDQTKPALATRTPHSRPETAREQAAPRPPGPGVAGRRAGAAVLVVVGGGVVFFF